MSKVLIIAGRLVVYAAGTYLTDKLAKAIEKKLTPKKPGKGGK